jgi:hypothetical protein
MGASPLLCRRDNFELDIPLPLTHRFLNRDYAVFDCCGMALRKAKLRPLFVHGPSARATFRYLVRVPDEDQVWCRLISYVMARFAGLIFHIHA